MFPLPYLTSSLPGVGGRIKERTEDFRVEEIPLYPLSGSGTHVYFHVVKSGLPTPSAVNRIARHMGVRPGDIGVAGLKDARGVTTQLMSLEHADADRLARFRSDRIGITVVGRHTNKLRTGLLAGNRFAVRIRGAGCGALDGAQAILDVLIRRGVPNFFDRQRFGARGDTADLGEAMVRNDPGEFVAIFLGRSIAEDPPDCKAARDAFDAGFFGRALKCWPHHYADPRRALSAYKRRKKPSAAIAAIDKRMKRLYVSAFQSRIFNEVLTRRLDTIDRVFVGDMARKSDTGGVFTVEDAAVEQPRADRFEISPTGPIFGYRSSLADGEMGRIEREALAAAGVELEDFHHVGRIKAKGSRRALRFKLDAPALTGGSDAWGEFLELTFATPPGAYATIVLQEIIKGDNTSRG